MMISLRYRNHSVTASGVINIKTDACKEYIIVETCRL